jgi:hypothetical protein
MKQLPKTDNPVVIRTDFENQQAWLSICELLRAPVHEGGLTFDAHVDFLDDKELRNLTPAELLTMVPEDYDHSFFFVVDKVAISRAECPILVVDLIETPNLSFRAIPSQIQGIANNLSIGNMDFEEFARAVDEDRIFRGFSKP